MRKVFKLETRIVCSESHRTIELRDLTPNRPLPYHSLVGKERQLSAFEFGAQRVVFTRTNLWQLYTLSRFDRDISVSMTRVGGMLSGIALYGNAELGVGFDMPHRIE